MNSQKIQIESKLKFGNYKNRCRIQATVRFEYDCYNGHNSFSVTAMIKYGRAIVGGGCCHDEIVKAFPELREAVKWHLWSTNGKLHHIATGLYLYKEKGIDALRKYVNCPDLTEEEANKEGLMKRLPEQLEQFKACVESLGMVYTTKPIC